MRFFLGMVLCILATACFSDPDCRITASSRVKIAFKSKEKSKDTALAFSRVRVSGTDSVFHIKDTTNIISLPVNPQTTETLLMLDRPSGTDSILVRYSILNVIINPDCGAQVYFVDLGYDTLYTTFEDVKIVNNQLSTGSAPNVEIKL